jgi:hypothetical protein
MAGPLNPTASLLAKISSYLGVSIYEPSNPPNQFGLPITDPSVIAARRAIGGNIQPIPETTLRWYLADLEWAQAAADTGNLEAVGQLYRAMRRDGVLMGLLAARTASLIRLPKHFSGDPAHVDYLRSKNGSRSVFDELMPPAELGSLASDGDVVGVGLAELVPVRGRDYPVMVRYDPQWLTYQWNQSRWYYNTRAARIPITPGDGRWVLHVPGGRVAPWQWGLWPALGRAFIMKEHALSLRGALIAGVANPAKVMQAPSGATEQQRRAMFQHVLQWGPNMAVELPVGWELKLLEFNGRSYEVFQQEIDTCDRSYTIALTGQEVTTTGGAGFQNSDVQRVIRSDITQATGENLAYTVNTQVLPWTLAQRFGEGALDAGTCMGWVTKQPKDQEATARMLGTFADALEKLKKMFPDLSMAEMATDFGIPIKKGGDPEAFDDIPVEVDAETQIPGAPGDDDAVAEAKENARKKLRAA